MAAEATQSPFGFVGEMGPEGAIHCLAIRNPPPSGCQASDAAEVRQSPENFQLYRMCGLVLRDGKSLLTNESLAESGRRGARKALRR